jgi:hypothetical protein
VASIVTADELVELGLGIFFDVEQQRIVKKSTNLDRFVAHYGCLPLMCAILWEDLQNTQVPRARVKRSNAVPRYFLMSLHHLKVYPTELQGEGPWHFTRKSRRKWIKCFLKKIRRHKAEKIVWPSWNEKDIWVISIDGTHWWIAEPTHTEWSQDKKYYSHKYNEAGISYKLGFFLSCT